MLLQGFLVGIGLDHEEDARLLAGEELVFERLRLIGVDLGDERGQGGLDLGKGED